LLVSGSCEIHDIAVGVQISWYLAVGSIHDITVRFKISWCLAVDNIHSILVRPYSVHRPSIKGTVQRKLTWVKSGINRKFMIGAWFLFYILRGLGPLNLNKGVRRLNDFSCGVFGICGVRYKIAL
jgi:hypothetical protein